MKSGHEVRHELLTCACLQECPMMSIGALGRSPRAVSRHMLPCVEV